jgi:hypothetical protein
LIDLGDDGYVTDDSLSSNDSVLDDWLALSSEMVLEMEIQQVVLGLVDAVIDLMEIAIVRAVQNGIASQQVVVVPLQVAEDPEGNVVVGVVDEAEVVEMEDD